MAPKEAHDEYRDGNWTGILGMIQRDEVDITFEIYNMIPMEPIDRIEFSIPLYYQRVSFLTQKPRPIAKNLILFQPFSWLIWMALIISILGFVLMFCGLNGKWRLCIRTFFSTLGSVLEQAFSVPLTSRHHVFLFVGWIVGISFLIYCFKAIFLSFLLAIPTKGINTISELASAVADGSVKCRTYAPARFRVVDELRRSKIESHGIIEKSVYENSNENDNFFKYSDPNNPYSTCFIAHEQDLSFLNNNMFISKDSFFHDMHAFSVRRKFRGKKALDKTLRRMFEAGFVEKLQKDLINKRIFKYGFVDRRETADTNKSITLEDLKGAFVILIVGLSLAFIVFINEIVFFWWRSKLRNKNSLKARRITKEKTIQSRIRSRRNNVRRMTAIKQIALKRGK